MRAYHYFILTLSLVLLGACSTKKNNFFTRQYHRLTTSYNVYFNGKEAFEAGLEKMARNHKEDYTNMLPVFVSNNEQTRALCGSDMDYAIEKAAKAIDKHSITAKPKRRKNKNSERYLEFRKKREYNDEIPKCYLLLGQAYFYKKKHTMANNTFRYIMRQYPDHEKLMTEVHLWMFRNQVEMGRNDEAEKEMAIIGGLKLNGKQQELFTATKMDYHVRNQQFPSAIAAGEELVKVSKNSKRTPRYHFILSQLYIQEGRDFEAMKSLKKVTSFNFNYEMVFNAKINMALAYREGDESVKKTLNKMLKDTKNEEYQDRIYYALGNIEEKKGNMEDAIGLYWNSVNSSVSNDNQKSLSFLKLGDYYFKQRDYVPAQLCYDSCMYFMDTRVENYDMLKNRVSDLTQLVKNLNTIHTQDSLQQLAALPEGERNRIIDEKIQAIKDEETRLKEQERQAQEERNFYYRNNMISTGGTTAAGSQSNTGEWYFYNPVTIAMGKNEFRRKWGRRRLEDNWRRINKSIFDPVDFDDPLVMEEGDEGEVDLKSREYYLKNIPLTEEQLVQSNVAMENAYFQVGELYLHTFNEPGKALENYEAFIKRFPESTRIPQVYYHAYYSANELGEYTKAAAFKEKLIGEYPDSDQAKGLLDPDYYKKTEDILQAVNRMYSQAYDLYRDVRYKEALEICNSILHQYPDNKLKSNVLFLKAMCIVNLETPEEARLALNEVLDSRPDKEISEVVSSILASMSVGLEPQAYNESQMSEERYLKQNRNWVFTDDLTETGTNYADEGEQPYRMNKEDKYRVLVLLPEGMKKSQELQVQGRLAFINAGGIVDGENYKTEKENLWYKTEVFNIGTFDKYEPALEYLNKVATDRILLKNFQDKDYRIFAISEPNLELLKKLKDIDGYLDFFINNYFDDNRKGDALVGKLGSSAHLFTYEDDSRHHFVIYLPFQRVNVNRIAGLLKNIEPAFRPVREGYDREYEFIVLENIGNKEQALEQMNVIMKNNELYERLKNISYEMFIITPSNFKILLDGKYVKEYISFFTDNYVRDMKGEAGIEDGDYIYNKNVDHKFILLYSNKIDPFKLKTEFEKINTAGLALNNVRYDESFDCLTVSGFQNQETAMRYFNIAIKNNAIQKLLRNTDYRNFIISDKNFSTMTEEGGAEKYLIFFKKYYLDR